MSGKSLGTLALGHLLTCESKLRDAEAIWLTPLLRDEELRAQIRKVNQRSLLIIGTRDTNYDAAYLNAIKTRAQWKIFVFDGADHSLEVAGHLSGSIKLLGKVMGEIEQFVAAQ